MKGSATMRSIHPALPILLAAGVLAGCGPKAGGDGKAGAASAPASAATPANLATTSKGAPQRRDGYWELGSYSVDGSQMDKQFYCVGAGSEEKYNVFEALAVVGNCSKKDFTRTAAGWTFETQCKLMDTTTTQTGTISGDFQQSFTIDQTVSQGPNQSIKGTIRGKRIGDCPANFKPGDLVDAKGEKIGNLLG